MNYKVGIIGNGFVGESQSFAFSPTSEVRVYDIDPLRSTHDLASTLECDFVFVAVPTPMNDDGSQNLSFIENVFMNAVEGPIYIIKSTILPGTTEKLIKRFKKHNETDLKLSEIPKVLKLYKDYAKKTKIDTLVLDTSKNSLQSCVNQILKWINK